MMVKYDRKVKCFESVTLVDCEKCEVFLSGSDAATMKLFILHKNRRKTTITRARLGRTFLARWW
jgi:hypothetical protein